MNRPRWASQGGSLPLTLLVTIVVGGVVVALFTVVRTGVDSSGRDRDFASAIQIADAGIQEAYLALLEVDDEDLDDPTTPVDACTPPDGAPQPTVEGGICQVEIEDGEYVFEYERVGTGKNWQVRSWGTYRDSTRLVTSFVGQREMFHTAILSVDTLDFAGGGTTVAGGVCTIPQFGIGAGGAIKLTGQTGACINQIVVYNQDLTDAPGSNYGTFANDCDSDNLEDCGFKYTKEDLNELNNLALEAFASGGECADSADHISTLPSTITRGETYCIDGNVDLSGTRVMDGDEDAGEATVFISGNLTFTANSVTNDGPDAEAGDLLFAVGGTNVVIRATAKAKAAIWAPAALCHSQGGAGTIGTFAGGMTCGTVQISGNWTYDASVEEIGGSDFAIRNWAERPPGGGPPIG